MASSAYVKSVRFGELVLGEVAIHKVIQPMSDEDFVELCKANPKLLIEQDKHGNLHIMSPVSLDSGNLESQIIADLTFWARKSKLGKTYSSNTLFILPDEEKRIPDAAWVSDEKLKKLSREERRSFARLVPDFIVEVKSPSDTESELDLKIRKIWIANGVRMAWYIDPDEQVSKIYLSDGSIQIFKGFDQTLSGGDVLPGFTFDLSILK